MSLLSTGQGTCVIPREHQSPQASGLQAGPAGLCHSRGDSFCPSAGPVPLLPRTLLRAGDTAPSLRPSRWVPALGGATFLGAPGAGLLGRCFCRGGALPGSSVRTEPLLTLRVPV